MGLTLKLGACEKTRERRLYLGGLTVEKSILDMSFPELIGYTSDLINRLKLAEEVIDSSNDLLKRSPESLSVRLYDRTMKYKTQFPKGI